VPVGLERGGLPLPVSACERWATADDRQWTISERGVQLGTDDRNPRPT
jgi:hypothetical protein